MGAASARRGAAANPVLIGLLVALAAFVLLWWLLPRPRSGPGSGPDGGAAPSAPPSTGETAPGPTAATPAPAEGDREDSPPPRFAGTGTLRGSVSAPAGTPFPTRWTLVLAPSPGQPGAEHAASRRVEYTAGERDFEVTDLPLGAYRVGIEAEGLNGGATTQLLERGREQAWIGLSFAPAGFLEGEVVEEGGAPLDGLTVVLEPLAGGERRPTRTDANGAFVFESVLDGEYRLHFGASDVPALEPRSLRFRAPSMRLPTVTAPRRARLALDVLDAVGVGVEGAEAWAEGPSGRTRLATDSAGHATFLLLAAGTWRVSASQPELGSAAEEVELAEGEHGALRLVLER